MTDDCEDGTGQAPKSLASVARDGDWRSSESDSEGAIVSEPRFRQVEGGNGYGFILDHSSAPCSFCGESQDSEPGVTQGKVAICGLCIDKARKMAGRE